MGEKEIVERETVTKRKSVTGCDFCGRDEHRFDTGFSSVRENTSVRIKPVQSVDKHGTFDFGERTSESVSFSISLLRDRDSIEDFYRTSEQRHLHLCVECKNAFTEVFDQ